MSRRPLFTILALTVALALAVVEPSFAASDIGKNIGDEVMAWAKALIFGTAALVGLPVLLQRDVAQGIVIVGLVMLLGGFVFAGDQVQGTVEGLWETVAGAGAGAEAEGK